MAINSIKCDVLDKFVSICWFHNKYQILYNTTTKCFILFVYENDILDKEINKSNFLYTLDPLHFIKFEHHITFSEQEADRLNREFDKDVNYSEGWATKPFIGELLTDFIKKSTVKELKPILLKLIDILRELRAKNQFIHQYLSLKSVILHQSQNEINLLLVSSFFENFSTSLIEHPFFNYPIHQCLLSDIFTLFGSCRNLVRCLYKDAVEELLDLFSSQQEKFPTVVEELKAIRYLDDFKLFIKNEKYVKFMKNMDYLSGGKGCEETYYYHQAQIAIEDTVTPIQEDRYNEIEKVCDSVLDLLVKPPRYYCDKKEYHQNFLTESYKDFDVNLLVEKIKSF